MTTTNDTKQLEAAAAKLLSNSSEAQLVTLLFEWVGTDKPSWLGPELQRQLWSTTVRFGWLLGRPDARARVVHETTGLSEGAAARLEPAMQIALVDAVVDNGDISTALWADAWEPSELGSHAPAGAVHSIMREAFPWNGASNKETQAFLVRWLDTTLSSGDGNGRSRKPILSPLVFRSAIDAKVWQESLPLGVRATVDAARLRSEWKKRPFTAAHELATVTIETLVETLPAKALKPVLEAAEKTLSGQSSAGQSKSDSAPVANKPEVNLEATQKLNTKQHKFGPASKTNGTPEAKRSDRTEEVPRGR